MSLQISDCTIRDGGYLTGKVFPEDFICGVIDGLTRAGIDYIETGFLQRQVGGEPVVYHNSVGPRRYLPTDHHRSEYVGFCDNSRYEIGLLDDCDHLSFESLRISFAKHERKEALQFCRQAKEKGYHVFVQPMDALGYTADERAEMIAEVNDFLPEAFAIVDTFGAMHLHNLKEIFRQVDHLLDRRIKVGLHSHNNLNLSCALVEELAMMAEESERSVAVDGSLLGMGRGAGNACTEAIAHLLNTRYGHCYDIPVLLDTIERYILPLRREIVWGYDMPMFLCGVTGSHVDNIYYLEQHTGGSLREMYGLLESCTPAMRKRYGEGYRKGDFTQLQQLLAKAHPQHQ